MVEWSGRDGDAGVSLTPAPVYPPLERPVRRRSVFSSSAVGLGRRIVQNRATPDEHARARLSRASRRDEPLQILDDLNDRPLDSLYQDASMTRRAHRGDSPGVRIFSDLIVFLLCIGIGVVSVATVRLLQHDGRRSVREKLASQMASASSRRTNLENDVAELEGKIQKQTDRLNSYNRQSPSDISDAIRIGSTAVKGQGITITLASRTASQDRQGRVASSFDEGSVSDLDLQEMADLIWKSGAEAVGLNGRRLGPQTSIRHAGSSVLVGTSAISPPYVFTAIGNARTMADMINNGIGSSLVSALEKRGISVTVAQHGSVDLPAASVTALTYASGAKTGTDTTMRKKE